MYVYMYSFKNNNVPKSLKEICFISPVGNYIYWLIMHYFFLFCLYVVCAGVCTLEVNISIFLQNLFMLFFSVVWFGFVLLMEFADSTRRDDCFKDISTYLRTGMRIKEDRDGGSPSLCEQAHERRYIFCQEQLKSSDSYIRM